MPHNKPGNGIFGWLGRQVGHVSKAIKRDVTRDTIYRKQSVEEEAHPEDPKLTLRRTTTDEVIHVRKK